MSSPTNLTDSPPSLERVKRGKPDLGLYFETEDPLTLHMHEGVVHIPWTFMSIGHSFFLPTLHTPSELLPVLKAMASEAVGVPVGLRCSHTQGAHYTGVRVWRTS